ncbi:NlpC/P60 family protein [Lutibacter sp.]|uniref:C40 family peptidase n=1 Tax=Lutibacter sp. TaxID=1925666 RepID=UPI003564EC2B
MGAYKFLTFSFFLTSSLIFSQTSIHHNVSEGESIYAIAKKYDVKETEIYELNPRVKGKLLQLNTVLQIPRKQDNIEEIEINTSNNDSTIAQKHVVVSRETLSKISKKYGISIKELERLNPAVIRTLPINYLLILKEETPSVEIVTKGIEINPSFENIEEVFVEPSIIQFLIETVSKNLGTRYRIGGTSIKGFDCSGLIFNAFKEINITLPRSSNQQSKMGTKKDKSQAQKGDLIFFATRGKGIINHVGMITEIVEDEIIFIHSSTHSGVIISSMKEPYYSKRYIQINNVL